MRAIIILFIILLGGTSREMQAQDSKPSIYDYALMKREYIGKNEIFSVMYRTESGKVLRTDGYIRALADQSRVAIYAYNQATRNYDILEISITDIQAITKSANQKTMAVEKKPLITMRGVLKTVGIGMIIGSLAFLIFHNKL